jgi:AbrB family looped-hinge helix DNA binding protein
MPKRPLKLTPIVRIRRKAQVTLPAKILKLLKLDEGSFLEASIKNGEIVLAPVRHKATISGGEYIAALGRVRWGDHQSLQ